MKFTPRAARRVDVRRLRLRMAAQIADPVVQVIDGDEQDVRPALGGRDKGQRLTNVPTANSNARLQDRVAMSPSVNRMGSFPWHLSCARATADC